MCFWQHKLLGACGACFPLNQCVAGQGHKDVAGQGCWLVLVLAPPCHCCLCCLNAAAANKPATNAPAMSILVGNKKDPPVTACVAALVLSAAVVARVARRAIIVPENVSALFKGATLRFLSGFLKLCAAMFLQMNVPCAR